MVRVAVTGANGLLGSTILRVFPVAGIDAVPIAADVRDADAVMKSVAESGVDVILHAAALTDVVACERDPERAFEVNAEGTRHVVTAARSIGARVVFVSTASVFSGASGNYVESDAPTPSNVYNDSKAQGEEIVMEYGRGCIVRLNIIGVHPDGSRGRNFMEWLVDSLRRDRDVSLFDDVRINALSNWTIADMLALIAKRESGSGIYHIGTRDVVSKAAIGREVVKRFPEYTGVLSESSVDRIADGVIRPKEMWLNCDYTARTLGVTMPSMHEEIERIFEHFSL